ncbi:hypothetical protein MMC18_000584 [Xylographa bjoerkii]|nr:hypothetical protein [Xylographa bjoerkii]
MDPQDCILRILSPVQPESAPYANNVHAQLKRHQSSRPVILRAKGKGRSLDEMATDALSLDPGPAYLFRRQSVDQINFDGLKPVVFNPVSGPPRPPSAFAQPALARPLSKIPEVSNTGIEDVEKHYVPKVIPRNEIGNVPRELLELNRTGATSTMSLPLSSVPERKSSRARLQRKSSQLSRSSTEFQPLPPAPARGLGHTVSVRGQSQSPVRSAVARLDPVSSVTQRVPSRTYVRPVKPLDILNVPQLTHSRAVLETTITAPLFMGGGTVEGQVHLVIDGGRSSGRYKTRPAISIGRLSIDILGVEMCHGRHSIFRSLAHELIDETYPPPSTMVAAPRAASDAFWEVMPCISVLPFRLDLPINMGPPPYKSRRASIKYILCATLVVRISGKLNFVRSSQEIAVLTVHDPEKALLNLASPLTASEEIHFSRFGIHDTIKLTAGVHRQTWVSGIALFVDVHISNSSQRTVKKIDLQLEKATTFYSYAPASTQAEMAAHLRLPDKTEKETMVKRSIKKGHHGWRGILPQSQDVRTCQLDIPPGLATIDTGRFFGVRYFLNIAVSSSFTSVISPTIRRFQLTFNSQALVVQIPITVIHPNSLDIAPNSVAQVASAIEHHHHRRQRSNASRQTASKSSPNGSPKFRNNPMYRYSQGGAFSAARRQSTEQLNSAAQRAEEVVEELTRELDGSPRKAGPRGQTRVRGHRLTASQESNNMRDITKPQRAKSHMRLIEPRLMRSTSGLGFDYSSSEESEGMEMGAGSMFHGMYRAKKSLRGREDERVQKDWAATYVADLAHHATNAAHTGTSWFADARAEEKITAYLHDAAAALGLERSRTTFLDLGAGNGSLLFALREEGWRGGMVGVDYAPEAVQLARRVGVERGVEVRFEVWDVMADGAPAGGEEWMPAGGWDVVLDKGTFDAVSLSEEGGARQRGVCERYAAVVRRLVRVGGVVLVTSCNWTEEELRVWFGGGAEGLEVCGRIRYPTFRFGGSSGQSVSSVCFRRVR